MLRAPHAFQTGRRIRVQQIRAVLPVTRGERFCEHTYIGDGEVHAFGAGRRHDVRGVAGKEQASVLHRLGDETAHRRDALLRDPADARRPAVFAGEARLQLGPDAVVGPLRDVFVGTALQIKTRHLRRTHAEERETAFVIRVDELVERGRRVSKNTEPCVWVNALVGAQHVGRNRRARNAVKAVAARDVIAFDPLRDAAMREVNLRRVARDVVQRHVADFEIQLLFAVQCRLDHVAHHFVLPIDGN